MKKLYSPPRYSVTYLSDNDVLSSSVSENNFVADKTWDSPVGNDIN